MAAARDRGEQRSRGGNGGSDGVRTEEEGRTLAPPAAPAKRDQGPSAAPEAAGHDNDGSDGARTEEEGRTPAPPAASAKHDQGPSAASEAAGHDNDGT